MSEGKKFGSMLDCPADEIAIARISTAVRPLVPFRNELSVR